MVHKPDKRKRSWIERKEARYYAGMGWIDRRIADLDATCDLMLDKLDLWLEKRKRRR